LGESAAKAEPKPVRVFLRWQSALRLLEGYRCLDYGVQFREFFFFGH
jgi:hypothetical protein